MKSANFCFPFITVKLSGNFKKKKKLFKGRNNSSAILSFHFIAWLQFHKDLCVFLGKLLNAISEEKYIKRNTFYEQGLKILLKVSKYELLLFLPRKELNFLLQSRQTALFCRRLTRV